MTKTLTLALIAFWGITLCSGQTVELEKIKSDPSYLYGEGRARTVKEADGYALSSIISQILVSVQSDVYMNQTESEESSSDSFEAIIKTYSSSTLTNTKLVIVENEPDAYVVRYIKKSDVERIFESRKTRITTMIEEAQSALRVGKVDDALRYLYWAHSLTKSLRYPNELYIYDEAGKRQMVNLWIPKMIDDILSGINISVSGSSDNELMYLNIDYKSQPVTSLEYSYYDGYGWSNLYSAQDGKGVVELRQGINLKKIELRIEYAFENETVIDPEIKGVLDVVPSSFYKKAYITLPLEGGHSERNNSAAVHSSEENSYPNLTPLSDIAPYQKIVDSVIEGIVSSSYSAVEHWFTAEGLKSYRELIGYGSARVVDATQPKYYLLGDKVYCRGILMNFSFRGNSKNFVESVVFEINDEYKISGVTFGLSSRAVKDIFGQTMWPEAARIILIHFLEGYQSAYALKQLDYIESVFADNALIITGNKVRTATPSEVATMGNTYVNYTTRSKGEYIRKLRSVFAQNEYININFAGNEILKAGKGGEIYGIQIKQEYSSTNYGDSGYLFLLVDLNDIEKPIIKVRTWQEDKDPVFGQYGLGHF